MTAPPDIPAALLTRFCVSDPEPVATTPIADVWKVRRTDGSAAALKVYRGGDMRNERPGFAYLSALNGRGAAKIHDLSDGAALIEWLDGPSLGDMTRAGQDADAAMQLVAVANLIHASPCVVRKELPDLADWFRALFDLRFAPDIDATARRDMMHCRDVARRLLAQQIDPVPLHGDLHHDNVLLGACGYCAFDAKGVIGERAYELANAFRNPRGVPELVQSPGRIRFLAATWSAAFHVDRDRLLAWAMVKVALSVAWRSGPVLRSDPEFGLLATIRGIAEAPRAP